MQYTKRIISTILNIILIFGLCSLCTANELKKKNKPLSLTLDTTEVISFSTPPNKTHVFENKPSAKQHKISKKIKKARDTLRKLTTFSFRKKQKVKAKFTKSSYILQYTHTL